MLTVTGKPQASETPSRTNSPSTGKRSRIGGAAVAALVRARLPMRAAASRTVRTLNPFARIRNGTETSVPETASGPVYGGSGAVCPRCRGGVGSLQWTSACSESSKPSPAGTPSRSARASSARSSRCWRWRPTRRCWLTASQKACGESRRRRAPTRWCRCTSPSAQGAPGRRRRDRHPRPQLRARLRRAGRRPASGRTAGRRGDRRTDADGHARAALALWRGPHSPISPASRSPRRRSAAARSFASARKRSPSTPISRADTTPRCSEKWPTSPPCIRCTRASRPSICSPCTDPAVRRRRSTPTGRPGGASSTPSGPSRAPSCAVCTTRSSTRTTPSPPCRRGLHRRARDGPASRSPWCSRPSERPASPSPWPRRAEATRPSCASARTPSACWT